MAYQHLAPFDSERDFVALTFFRAAGTPVERGDPFDKELVDSRTLKLLYDNHKIGFAEATDAEATGSIAPATIEDVGDGWYVVAVPWGDEGERVQGKDAATMRAQELRDAGEPNEHHGVAIVEGKKKGWYAVNAAWLDEPESIHGADAAYERATALRAEGPPADFNDGESLLGSDNFEATYEIGGTTVALGDLVAAAQAASGHGLKVWNGLDGDTRDSLIRTELDRRLTEAGAGTGGGAESDGGATDQADAAHAGDSGRDAAADAGGDQDKPPSVDDRIKVLVDGNTEKVLRTMASKIDEARAAATPPLEPLGLKSDHDKTEIATLIVGADGDLETGGDGGAA